MSFQISYVIFGQHGLDSTREVAKAIFSRLDVATISQLRWCRSRSESPWDPEWIPSDSDVSVDLFLNSLVHNINGGVYYMAELYETKMEREIDAHFRKKIGRRGMGKLQIFCVGVIIGEHYITTSPYDEPSEYQKCGLSFHFTGNQWPDDWPAFEQECLGPVKNETLLALFKEIHFKYKTGCSTS